MRGEVGEVTRNERWGIKGKRQGKWREIRGLEVGKIVRVGEMREGGFSKQGQTRGEVGRLEEIEVGQMCGSRESKKK